MNLFSIVKFTKECCTIQNGIQMDQYTNGKMIAYYTCLVRSGAYGMYHERYILNLELFLLKVFIVNQIIHI